jgi:hypothetical protein
MTHLVPDRDCPAVAATFNAATLAAMGPKKMQHLVCQMPLVIASEFHRCWAEAVALYSGDTMTAQQISDEHPPWDVAT